MPLFFSSAILFLMLSSQSVLAAVEAVCLDWFARTKIAVSDSGCVSKCSASSVDLGTFNCTDRCDELCRPVTNCEMYRKGIGESLIDSSPQNWGDISEKVKPWTAQEKRLAINAMMTLPRKLVERSRFRIHRTRIAKFKDNPAASTGDSILLYDRAFRSPPPLARVLAHELAHVYWNDMTVDEKRAYRIAANWIRLEPSGKLVPGRAAATFAESDGTISMTEDFANNVEYLLFDPQKLKALTPSLFAWLRTTLGDKFVVGGECVHSERK